MFHLVGLKGTALSHKKHINRDKKRGGVKPRNLLLTPSMFGQGKKKGQLFVKEDVFKTLSLGKCGAK